MNSQLAIKHAQDHRLYRAINNGIMLIELLIGLTIGLFLITGAFNLYSQTRRVEHFSDISFQLRENTNFALNLISHDLRMANFWGRHTTATHIVLQPDIKVSCKGKDVGIWALNLLAAVETNRDGYTPPCEPHLIAEDSDVLTVRYAESKTSKPRDNWLQLYTDQRWGYLHTLSSPSPEGLINPANFTLVINSYYVEHSDTEKTPELRRWSLGKNGILRNELVIDGIKTLRVQFANSPLDAAMAIWANQPGENVSLARIEITATGQYLGSQIEQTTTQIIHLKNMATDNSAQQISSMFGALKQKLAVKQNVHSS